MLREQLKSLLIEATPLSTSAITSTLKLKLAFQVGQLLVYSYEKKCQFV